MSGRQILQWFQSAIAGIKPLAQAYWNEGWRLLGVGFNWSRRMFRLHRSKLLSAAFGVSLLAGVIYGSHHAGVMRNAALAAGLLFGGLVVLLVLIFFGKRLFRWLLESMIVVIPLGVLLAVCFCSWFLYHKTHWWWLPLAGLGLLALIVFMVLVGRSLTATFLRGLFTVIQGTAWLVTACGLIWWGTCVLLGQAPRPTVPAIAWVITLASTLIIGIFFRGADKIQWTMLRGVTVFLGIVFAAGWFIQNYVTHPHGLPDPMIAYTWLLDGTQTANVLIAALGLMLLLGIVGWASDRP